MGTNRKKWRLGAPGRRTRPWHPLPENKQGVIPSKSLSAESCNIAMRELTPHTSASLAAPLLRHHITAAPITNDSPPLSLTPAELMSSSFWLFQSSFSRTNILTKIFLAAFIFPLLHSPLSLIKCSLVVRMGQGGFLSLSAKEPTEKVFLISHQHKMSFHYANE